MPEEDEVWGNSGYKCVIVRIVYNFSLRSGGCTHLVEYFDQDDESVVNVMDIDEFTRRYELKDLG